MLHQLSYILHFSSKEQSVVAIFFLLFIFKLQSNPILLTDAECSNHFFHALLTFIKPLYHIDIGYIKPVSVCIYAQHKHMIK